VGGLCPDNHLLTTRALGSTPPVFSTAKDLRDVEDPQDTESVMTSSRQRRHTALLNKIPVGTLDSLTQSDIAVLNYLDKLAREGRRDACTASIPRMADACGISERQVQISVKRLIDAELIERLGYDFSNANRAKRGTIYKVLLRAGGEQQTVIGKERKRTIKFLLIWSEE
jgi:hypothetical protein